jgi:hypothetical protein
MPRKTNNTVYPTIAPTIGPTIAPTYDKPSVGSTILQGFALGTGQSLAFNMFRTEPVKETVKETVKEPVKEEEEEKEIKYKEFVKCMKDNTYEDCKQYLNL